MFIPLCTSFIYVLTSGGSSLASGNPTLRGNLSIRDQEERTRPPVLRKNPADENGIFRINHRRDNDSELKKEQGQKLYTACIDARAEVRSHVGQGIDAADGSDELLLAAQIACNTWFAWTDDR